MSVFVLKIIAIIAMIIDHMGIMIYGFSFSWMRCIGRIAFPIFAFLIAEGCYHTSNKKKYFIRLLIFSLVSQIPFYLFLKSSGENLWHFNVGFTLLLGFLSIALYEKASNCLKKYRFDKITDYMCRLLIQLAILLIAIFAFLINTDYGGLGVILIFLFYYFRKKKLYLNISIILLFLFEYCSFFISNGISLNDVLCLLTLLFSLFLINLYNGKKGYSAKWLFYLVYPIHLLIFALIERLI